MIQRASLVIASLAVATIFTAAAEQKLRRPGTHEVSTPTTRGAPAGRGLLDHGHPHCDPGTSGCKSVCRWLGFSAENEHYEHSRGGGPPTQVCLEVEERLEECDYVPQEDRKASAPSHPFDCAVTILRQNVLERQLQITVDRLLACLEEIPDAEKGDCRAASALLDVELGHWRGDARARAEAAAQREQLEAAIDEGKTALETKVRTREAMASLSEELEAAEAVPGFYLRETIHIARGMLLDLNPIALALEELALASKDGQKALESKDGYRCEQAILRLGIAMNNAEEYEIEQPLNDAEALEADLERVSSAAEEMNAAIVQANSSHATVSCMGKSLARLQSSIDAAKEVGITRRVREAERVFSGLFDLKMAFIEMKAAILQGETAIAAGVGESLAIDELELALNSSAAVSLHKALPTAVDILHELVRVQGEHSVEEIPAVPNR